MVALENDAYIQLLARLSGLKKDCDEFTRAVRRAGSNPHLCFVVARGSLPRLESLVESCEAHIDLIRSHDKHEYARVELWCAALGECYYHLGQKERARQACTRGLTIYHDATGKSDCASARWLLRLRREAESG